MLTNAMPITALAVLVIFAGAIGLVGALFTVLILLAVLRERKDIRRAKEIAKAKKEMKDRARRLKEKEAKEGAESDAFFIKYKEFVDGI